MEAFSAEENGAGGAVSHYRWAVLAAFGSVLFAQALLWLTFAPLESEAQMVLGVGHFPVRMLALVDPLTYIIVGAGLGMLADRRGFRFTVSLGLGLMVPAALARSLAIHFGPAGSALYGILLAAQVVISVGAFCCIACIFQMPVKWFPAGQRASATGLTTMSLLAGNAVVFPLAAWLGSVPAGAGRHEAQMGLARVLDAFTVIAALIALVFLLVIRDDPPLPLGESELHTVPDRRVARGLFKLADFRAIALTFFWGLGIYGGLMVTMEKLMLFHGFDSRFAALVGGGLTLGGILGSLALPRLSDRLGLRRPFVYLAAGMTVPCVLVLGFWGSRAMDLAAALLLGFCMLATQPIIFAMLGEMEDVGPRLAGTAVGALFAFGSLGQVLLPMTIELLRRTGAGGALDYRWALLILGAVGVVGFLLIMHSIPETGPGRN